MEWITRLNDAVNYIKEHLSDILFTAKEALFFHFSPPPKTSFSYSQTVSAFEK